MNKSDITSALKRNGFVFTDVETPGGTVRVTARGPKLPADPGNDGERDTVVRAVHEGENPRTLRVQHSKRGCRPVCRARGDLPRRIVGRAVSALSWAFLSL